MSALINTFLEIYNKAMEEWADPRLKDVFLFQSPAFITTFVVSYLLICYKIGPKFMEDREPYNINKVLIGYNIVQILANGYGVIVGTPLIMNQDWRCTTVDYEVKDSAIMSTAILYLYLKAFDLLDTVFSILRKNYRQISFLHVYHHASMVFYTWIIIKFFCGGPLMYIVYLNLIVHTVMYFYYLLCSFNEKHKKSIWWKKHLTQLQMVQFVLIFLVHFQQLFRDCPFHRGIVVGSLMNTTLIIYLFGIFYYKTYIKKNK